MEIIVTAAEDSTSENVPESEPGHRSEVDTDEDEQPSNLHHLEDKLRRKLQFFFMNPIEKWYGKRRIPWKFLVQVIKIVLVTLQLCIYAHDSHSSINYLANSEVTFSHLFLKGWNSGMEINAYPPDAGPLAVYTISDFYDALDFSCNRYANLSNAVGPYVYDDKDADPVLCIQSYQSTNETERDRQIIEKCVNITRNENSTYSSVNVLFPKLLKDVSAILKASLSFSVKTMRRKTNPNTALKCYRFDILIVFQNINDDGRMKMALEAEPFRFKCSGKINDRNIIPALETILNICVICICSLSFYLCCRSMYKALMLQILTAEFFKKQFHRELTLQGKLEFLDLWYLMIIINDVLIVVGSILKLIETWIYVDQYLLNCISVFLGSGNMLVWFGVLRYLGFFETYNIVILTLKNAAPRLLRFLLCAVLIYAGFTLCGWLILGPYHLKFRTLLMTCECLFSLINGDDMFASFYSMEDTSPMIWWYSRVYFYSFISLYIYAILSLFLAVIMDSHDTIKKYYIEGFPKNDLQDFVGTTCFEDVSSGIYRVPSSASLNAIVKVNSPKKTILSYIKSNTLTVPN